MNKLNISSSSYIYFDNSSTTRIDPCVLDAMTPYLTNLYANASSGHIFGTLVNQAIKHAREAVAKLIQSESHEIFFTSGATESINWAIKGIAEAYKTKGNHIITTEIEHSAVLDVCSYLSNHKYRITYLPVSRSGLVDPKSLLKAIDKQTILVSIMMANNEIGTIQPIKTLAEITRKQNAIFMTDATQAFGKIPINVNTQKIDLLTFSSHKIYGPKGVGGLYLKSKLPNNIKLPPLLHGGGQEMSLRNGTYNVAGIVGLGRACEIAFTEMLKDSSRLKKLRDKLENSLLAIPKTHLNGDPIRRLSHISNISFENVDNKAAITGLGSICVSGGSACSTTSISPSHVLKALGCSDKEAFSSLRFSLGRFNTEEEVKQVVKKVKDVVTKLRSFLN